MSRFSEDPHGNEIAAQYPPPAATDGFYFQRSMRNRETPGCSVFRILSNASELFLRDPADVLTAACEPCGSQFPTGVSGQALILKFVDLISHQFGQIRSVEAATWEN